MTTQDAIYYIRRKIICWTDEDDKNRMELVNLLKGLHNYKKIWEKLKRKHGSYHIYCSDNPDIKQTINNVMEEMEQISNCEKWN